MKFGFALPHQGVDEIFFDVAFQKGSPCS